MITIIRTRTLAALRAQAAEPETAILIRARSLALEIGSYLAVRPNDTTAVVTKAGEVARWITAWYPDLRGTETRILAATRVLADFRSADGWSCCYPSEFITAAERYLTVFAAPADTRPAADLSTGQPWDGAIHQHSRIEH